MSVRIRDHIRSNVIGYLALFVALSGTAYAVDGPLPGQNQVGSADIINGEVMTGDINDTNGVRSVDVRDDTLTGGGLSGIDIANGSLRSADIGDGSLTGNDISYQSIDTGHIQDDTIYGGDVANGGLGTLDISDNNLTGVDINNGTLNDEDVGQGTFVNFLASIGVVPAHSCIDKPIEGIDAQGDHLLLAANWDGSSSQLSYSVEYRTSSADAQLKACNPTNSAIDDSFTRFNLLVFDAQ